MEELEFDPEKVERFSVNASGDFDEPRGSEGDLVWATDYDALLKLYRATQADGPSAGTLIVGHDPERNEVVVNHPEIRPNAKGAGYIGFTAAEARHLAELLIKNAERCEQAEQRSTNEGGAMDETEEREQYRLGLSMLGKDVRFLHQPMGQVHRVTNLKSSGMVNLNDLTGDFAPHLFCIVGPWK